MNAPMQLTTMKQQGDAVAIHTDQAVDMFTERGFTLANRIAKAYASSSAVPAQFQAFNLKKVNRDEHWVENPSAIGNCLIAIEVARAVGMSITAVMQNADMIQGKLRWSGKFVIAAINASGRFTPLRFDMKNKGPITAKYKEKTGWDKEAGRPVFTERTVEVENIECIAWALPKGTPVPAGVYTLAQAEAAGLPVVKSAKVSMKMVVEEGWYGKLDSKWQGEMAELMFQYRAGSFFGNIHAPDIVMGMGQTSEEARDIAQTFDVAADGRATPVPLDELRQPAPGPVAMVEEVGKDATASTQQPQAAEAKPAAKPAGEWEPTPEELAEIQARERAEAGAAAGAGPAASPTPAATTSRRTRAAAPAVE